jgi:hypothetical protein
MQTIPANKELEKEKDVGVDEYGWPIGFFEETAGAFQGELLVREHQGEYEVRLELDD